VRNALSGLHTEKYADRFQDKAYTINGGPNFELQSNPNIT